MKFSSLNLLKHLNVFAFQTKLKNSMFMLSLLHLNDFYFFLYLLPWFDSMPFHLFKVSVWKERFFFFSVEHFCRCPMLGTMSIITWHRCPSVLILLSAPKKWMLNLTTASPCRPFTFEPNSRHCNALHKVWALTVPSRASSPCYKIKMHKLGHSIIWWLKDV